MHPAALTRLHMSSDPKLPKVAVVLSGCGVYDGSEITEAVSTLISLSGRADYQVFAPNENQKEVINHTNGEKMKETRNVMVESARIARGKVKSIDDLKGKDYDAVIFPGGFGVAKNLSSFAFDNASCRVNTQVERVIKEFHKLSKPLGFCCIAPVLAARLISGVQVTVGNDKDLNGMWPYAGVAEQITKMGGKHVVKSFHLAHIDQTNKVVSAPAYMYEGTPQQIFQSVGSLVDGVMSLL